MRRTGTIIMFRREVFLRLFGSVGLVSIASSSVSCVAMEK